MCDKIIWTHRLNGTWRVRKTLDFARAKSLENAFPEKTNLKKWHLELVTFSEKRIPVSTYFVFFSFTFGLFTLLIFCARFWTPMQAVVEHIPGHGI